MVLLFLQSIKIIIQKILFFEIQICLTYYSFKYK